MKTIYMNKLAQQYFPHSTPRNATSHLHRWIALNPELTARLKELHFAPRQRALTPLQYDAVIEYLGEPKK